jgi:hypothetical protein
MELTEERVREIVREEIRKREAADASDMARKVGESAAKALRERGVSR